MRLRQAVLVAGELEPVEPALREALGLGEPFRDPGVGEFGLRNAVFALGDCFLEVVSPIAAGAPPPGAICERHGGDGGYMVMFDLEDLDGARARAEQAGVRVVWQIDLPDISGTHLHPADMRGAIVSLDQLAPVRHLALGRTASGPSERAPARPGAWPAITVAVGDPAAVAARWADVLGVPLRAAGRADAGARRRRGALRRRRRGRAAAKGIVEIAASPTSPALAERRRGIERRRRAPARRSRPSAALEPAAKCGSRRSRKLALPRRSRAR